MDILVGKPIEKYPYILLFSDMDIDALSKIINS